uniref:Sec13-like protein n=1 Tax=Rhizophora mucronata TaxID=61149 RepID=A0A2P2KV21_RHIMU
MDMLSRNAAQQGQKILINRKRDHPLLNHYAFEWLGRKIFTKSHCRVSKLS